MKMKYYVSWYGGHGNHKSWGVYRRDPVIGDSLVCVCCFKKGAENAAAEMNTLTINKGELI